MKKKLRMSLKLVFQSLLNMDALVKQNSLSLKRSVLENFMSKKELRYFILLKEIQ